MRRGIAYQSAFVAAVLSLSVSTLPAAESDRPPVEAPRPGAVAPGGAPATETKALIPDGAEEFMPSKGKAAKTGTDALGGNEEWMEDPFKNIGSDMKTIVSDLGATETHVPSTETQPRVLSRLDVLIAQLEKACKKGGGGAAGGNPSSPANKSTLGGGPGGKGELRAPGDSRKKWAELTPKEREKILQSQTQGFPAGYEDLLAEYFRRLSQGKTVAAATDDASSGNETPANRASKPSTGADK